MDTDFEQLDAWVDRMWEIDAAFSIKIVVFDETDFAYAKQVFKRYAGKTSEFYLSVGNPNPRSGDDIRLALLDRLEQLFTWVIADPEMNEVKPLPQLHTLVWSNKRGV
jgi:7-carboxy-7-deazaguanine synthase